MANWRNIIKFAPKYSLTMEVDNTSKLYSLSDYIAHSHNITSELLARIHDNIQKRDILSSIIISVDDRTVAQLPTGLIIGDDKISNNKIQVWSYDAWRTREAASLSTDYDRRRFNLTTSIEVLRRKVQEHLQYSFIARSPENENSERVIKYTFVCVCPECRVILGTRQEITKSLEHDFLTGGLNREGLLRELTLKFKERKPDDIYSLLSFNIKGFRVINDLHGVLVGDKVLQHMYTQLVYSELNPISYARFESDHFICLIKQENLDTEVIRRLCQQECVIDSLKVNYRSTCGIYRIDNYNEKAYSACAHARLAATFVKDQFITPWMEFNPQMQEIAISDSELLDEIEDAVANHEFEAFYQPIINTLTGKIEFAEALVRWRSPEHGLISPAVFIPVLERNGGLSRIDQMMEKDVYEMLRRRHAAGQKTVPIDLNLSWTDFADSKLIKQIEDHILDKEVPSELIRFEITESAYEEIADNRLDVLNFFQEHNVNLLVDDFGQGYSFGTMKNVDFEIVKLDKSLIEKLGESRKMDLLVKSVINMFHELNSKLVAEGVENENQVEYLRKVGCDYIQGYYYYRPMDSKAFEELLDKLQQSEEADGADVTSADETDSYEPLGNDAQEDQSTQLRRLQEENRCMHMLLEEMNIHLFEWDVRTKNDLASEKFCAMYGMTSNIIPNMPDDIPLVIPEDRDRFRAFYHRISSGEKMGSDTFRLYKPDGKSYSWFQKTFFTLFDDNGLPYKAIITMQDTTDKYRYRILRTRDRMLTMYNEIVTFIYTVADDTFSFNYYTPNGEVKSVSIANYLNTPEENATPDQMFLKQEIRHRIEAGPRTGQLDFHDYRLNMDFRAHYTMIDGDYGSLYAIIGQAEDIKKTREQLEAKERLIQLAELDGLTQIKNRATGEREITKLLEQHETGIFGILDIDNFKSVNDTYGHVAGDNLLRAVANVMKLANAKGVNMRLGGDEFAFFLKSADNRDKIEQGVNSFFSHLSKIKIPGLESYKASVSVGIVMFSNEEEMNFDSLYRKADILLYQSKRTKGNKLTM